ncbi:hypothetical protein GCM10027280_45270 [Micromonospora polyrhachis]|uniref:Uncharacterized protein n=1 Tax=Micromonospora polyrhachis TaxID=1282883 RepID=A0A7W7SQ90_9ACTN|nr:hypothetical protein [Micromonospora polyrhachis]MBB4958959.1 hypothetical protein [Micromonospora polyrhachis]
MTQPPEPLYTLAQARQLLLEERCALQGHQLSMVDGSASRLACGHCRNVFNLVVEPPPTVPTGGE